MGAVIGVHGHERTVHDDLVVLVEDLVLDGQVRGPDVVAGAEAVLHGVFGLQVDVGLEVHVGLFLGRILAGGIHIDGLEVHGGNVVGADLLFFADGDLGKAALTGFLHRGGGHGGRRQSHHGKTGQHCDERLFHKNFLL